MKTKIMVAAPSIDAKYHGSFLNGMLGLVQDPAFDVIFYGAEGGSFIPHVRDRLITLFLRETSANWCLWIDSDVGFTVKQVRQLLSHDKDFVSGFYPAKEFKRLENGKINTDDPYNYMFNYVRMHTEDESDPDATLIELAGAAFGFVLMRRNLAEKVCTEDLLYVHRGIERYGAFHPIQRDGRSYGEDMSFCLRALDAGFQLWGDQTVMLPHEGTFTYGSYV